MYLFCDVCVVWCLLWARCTAHANGYTEKQGPTRLLKSQTQRFRKNYSFKLASLFLRFRDTKMLVMASECVLVAKKSDRGSIWSVFVMYVLCDSVMPFMGTCLFHNAGDGIRVCAGCEEGRDAWVTGGSKTRYSQHCFVPPSPHLSFLHLSLSLFNLGGGTLYSLLKFLPKNLYK